VAMQDRKAAFAGNGTRLLAVMGRRLGRWSAAGSVLLLLLALLPSTHCRRRPWYYCHYRAVLLTGDERTAVPCVAEALTKGADGAIYMLAETRTSGPGPVHGWARVVRPDQAITIEVELKVRCEGYREASLQFAWHPTPDTCRPGVEVGEINLEPSP
jgi:hypothetical protein